MIVNKMTLTSNVEQNVINANNKIVENLGLPIGITTGWANVRKAYNQDFWWIIMPPAEGWNGHSQESMMQDVINMQEQLYNTDWQAPME